VSGGAAIVGVGGLGAPAAAALAAAGARRLSLFDPDAVEISNLPRQPLYGMRDLGRPKVEVARERLQATQPRLAVAASVARIDAASAAARLAGHDVIVDGTDDLATKVLLNQTALALGIPLVHAGAIGLEGQLTTILPHQSACLRCLFVELPDEGDLPTCQQAGILGPVVGAIGLLAAREALAVLEGRPPGLANRLAILAAVPLRWRIVELRPNPRCPACHAASRACV
jgi:adenylyltransferase/sulfurtransferase